MFFLDLWLEALGIVKVMPGHLLQLWVHVEELILNLVIIYALIPDPEWMPFYQQESVFLNTLDP